MRSPEEELDSPSLTVQQREQIEKHLLDAMKLIDKVRYIVDPSFEYGICGQEFIDIKKHLKRVLNDRYDACARRRLANLTVGGTNG